MKKEKVTAHVKFLTDIKTKIVVASGKGGVGKSTVAANLALALAETGQRVGLLDADIYGPNIPIMLGLQGKVAQIKKGKLLPIEAFSLKIMSLGFISEAERALIWRGPLAIKLIEQFLSDVDWADLDTLIIDLPPGTGDVPLSLIQKLDLTGSVIVTTPEDVAVADVKKMIDMFQTTKVNILGLVENNKYVTCPDCSKRIPLYSADTGTNLHKRLKIKQLAEFPFDPEVNMQVKERKVFFFENRESPLAAGFRDLAQLVLKTTG